MTLGHSSEQRDGAAEGRRWVDVDTPVLGDAPPPTTFQGLPRAGHSDLGHPVLRDPAQEIPGDSRSLDAVHPKAQSRQPAGPAPDPGGRASDARPALGVASALSQVPAKELDRFVQHHLTPSPQFQEQVKRAIDATLRCLRETCAYKPSRVIKGGSFGRGTNLRGGCDAELILFLNCFSDFKDQGPRRAEIVKEMRTQVESWWQDPVPGLRLTLPEQNGPSAGHFRLVSADPESWVDVSLLPAFDAVGQLGSDAKPQPQVYRTLLNSGGRDGEHAACFAQLRRDFVNRSPTKLKNLILLVKHWYRHVAAQNEGQAAHTSLPPAYALELLTIFSWEQGCGKDAFSLAQGLRTVLGLIQRHQQLCVFWTVNYGFEDPAVGTFLRGQLGRPRPVILDPADPTWDVGSGTAWHWDVLAREAQTCYHHPCFLEASGRPVQPWEGLVPAKELDRFVQDHLTPSPQFQEQVKRAIDATLRCLRETCAYKPSRVIKGGSFGRGTNLRGGCDAELILFLNCFSDFKDQGPRRAEIVKEMRTQVESWWQDPVPGLRLTLPEQNGPSAGHFRLVSADPESWVDVSLLPAFDAVGEGACAWEGDRDPWGPGARKGATCHPSGASDAPT
ncbi:2'-5'-oligoadenylate synthase 3 [Sciurus carolinensis]|uniref:2'-5' oligoadenylate synthase n=1 Tax=Sciurus carolinensis TaxID=30640 RepID=A0AA41MLW8_SCICA|nr:2'-5'-oligoadenylate synthase 3 [Sciurus carolinensis]